MNARRMEGAEDKPGAYADDSSSDDDDDDDDEDDDNDNRKETAQRQGHD